MGLQGGVTHYHNRNIHKHIGYPPHINANLVVSNYLHNSPLKAVCWMCQLARAELHSMIKNTNSIQIVLKIVYKKIILIHGV